MTTFKKLQLLFPVWAVLKQTSMCLVPSPAIAIKKEKALLMREKHANALSSSKSSRYLECIRHIYLAISSQSVISITDAFFIKIKHLRLQRKTWACKGKALHQKNTRGAPKNYSAPPPPSS